MPYELFYIIGEQTTTLSSIQFTSITIWDEKFSELVEPNDLHLLNDFN